MSSLKDVIAALREEIGTALAGPDEPFAVRRAVVTLEVTIQKAGKGTAGPVSFSVASAESPKKIKGRPTDRARHTITIEFELYPLSGEKSQTAASTVRIDPALKVDPHELRRQFTILFGEPGFDNAARATVFREILESLSASQLKALLDSFAQDPSEVPRARLKDSKVANARSRLTRLLKLGPAGLDRARPVMLTLLRHHPVATLLEFVRVQWKTQNDWIDNAGGSPELN